MRGLPYALTCWPAPATTIAARVGRCLGNKPVRCMCMPVHHSIHSQGNKCVGEEHGPHDWHLHRCGAGTSMGCRCLLNSACELELSMHMIIGIIRPTHNLALSSLLHAGAKHRSTSGLVCEQRMSLALYILSVLQKQGQCGASQCGHPTYPQTCVSGYSPISRSSRPSKQPERVPRELVSG